MASRRTKLIATAAVATLGVGGYFLYSLFAAQGQGTLAQEPLNTQVQIPPGFVMAVDDSGSMTFQHQFPAADGYGCWSTSGRSFFSSPGVLRTSGTTCSYAYSYAGPRNGNTYRGIPPVDTFGFSRSSAYNPSYFDPTVRYSPWVRADGTPYPNASLSATLVDPRLSSTINLASWVQEADVRSRFTAWDKMVLPGGTQYRLIGNSGCGGLLGNGWHTVGTGGHGMTNTCDLYIRYWPATFFMPYSGNSDPYPEMEGTTGAYSGVTRTRVQNVCGAGCDMWKYTITSSNTQALQNFANWFSYYGNRNRAMVAGMTLSMATVNNMRVGYLTINDNASFDDPVNNASERVYMRDMSQASDRTALYGDMIALDATGSTPNRRAVMAASRQFLRTDSSRGGAPVQLACQKNAVMLFTDGFSNGADPSPAPGNIDGAMGPPFQDGHSTTMADIATQFYLDNGGAPPIRPELTAGQVPVPSACPSSDPKLDCQANLHVNFYGVTLGGRGNLYDPESPADAYTTPAIYNNWPSHQANTRNTVDDIWHATVNTRGDFISARTPADITEAMRRVLASVTSGNSPSGTIALTGARIGSGSLTVVPSYKVENEGTDWSSELQARQVEVDALGRVAEFSDAWEASSKIPGHESRQVFFGRNDNSVDRFQHTNTSITLPLLCDKPTTYVGMSRCTEAELSALGVDAAAAIRYLLGDNSGEVKNGGTLRDRTTALGDIVNSTPAVSSPLDDYGYRPLTGSIGTTYATFLNNKRTDGTRYMVYVGANDGMLHAFDGGMDADNVMDSNGGEEVFAYIPTTAIGHMGNLLFPYDAEDRSDQKFRHRYYVDGPVTVSDACFGNCNVVGDWNTVLVGTAGAGGRSVFALNVTDPGSFGASDRLWEISDLNDTLTADERNNIGHVLGEPVVVPVKTRTGTPRVKWKAIFGNGYNSANGKAVLYVVEVETGKIEMIEAVEEGADVPVGTCRLGAPACNGLGNVVAIDRWSGSSLNTPSTDGYTDTVYAADQHGALWKFDLREESPDDIDIPLFVTRTHSEGSPARDYRQPITGGLTAAAGPGGGVLVYFGTGSFSFYGDPDDETLQSLYAVNDTERGPTTGTFDRGDLRGYEIQGSSGVRQLEEVGSVISTGRGWYVDLATGERFVGNPRIASGVVFMPTYSPDGGTRGCSTGGFNSLFGLNARTGVAALSAVRIGSPDGNSPGVGTAAMPLDTDGSAPVREVGVLVLPRAGPLPPPPPPSGGGAPPGPPPPPDQGCWMLVTADADPAKAMYLPYPCGRQSWRQIE